VLRQEVEILNTLLALKKDCYGRMQFYSILIIFYDNKKDWPTFCPGITKIT